MESKVLITSWLLIDYLRESKLIPEASDAIYKDQGKKNITLMINIDESKSQRIFGESFSQLEIILVEMSSAKKVMVSICNEDKSLKQGVFDYSLDLNILDKMPDTKEKILSLLTKQSRVSFQNKFGFLLSVISESCSRMPKDTEMPHSHSRSQIPCPSFRIDPPPELSQDLGIGTLDARKPDDMPGFEDEYEILSTASKLQGTHPLPTNPTGYGDLDLYPTGERNPNLFEPNPSSRFLGGMKFDFSRPADLPLPYGGSFNPNNPDNSKKPPGFVPGSRWNSNFNT